MFFVRTEEAVEDAKAALRRGRSVRRWAFAGCSPWEHLAFAIPEEEQVAALEAYGYDIFSEEFDTMNAIHDELFTDSDDEKLAEILNLEPFEDGGYAEFLDGLCSLEDFDTEPRPEDCTATLDGALFPYLVCYEGEPVGTDPDAGWTLFRPTRIVWIHKTGQTGGRMKNI